MTTPETRCAPKHPTLRSDRMPGTKGGPDNAQTLPGPDALGSPTRPIASTMSKDTESPAGGVNEGLRGRAIEAAAAQSWWDDYGAGWDNGDTTEDDKAERREQVGPMVDAVLTVLPSGDGIRDALPRPGDAVMAAEDAELAARVLALLDRAEDAECAMVPIAVLDAVIHGDWPQPGWPEPTGEPQPGSEGLREALREVVDEPREDMRMDAYYFSFEPTGVTAIDRILSEVAIAGKAYHHTENWYDGMTADDRYENSHQQRIQRAAEAAALALRALLAAPTDRPAGDA